MFCHQFNARISLTTWNNQKVSIHLKGKSLEAYRYFECGFVNYLVSKKFGNKYTAVAKVFMSGYANFLYNKISCIILHFYKHNVITYFIFLS